MEGRSLPCDIACQFQLNELGNRQENIKNAPLKKQLHISIKFPTAQGLWLEDFRFVAHNRLTRKETSGGFKKFNLLFFKEEGSMNTNLYLGWGSLYFVSKAEYFATRATPNLDGMGIKIKCKSELLEVEIQISGMRVCCAGTSGWHLVFLPHLEKTGGGEM